MAGKKLVTDRQWEIILAYMMKHKCLIDGGAGGVHLWHQLAHRLNAVPNGINKSSTRWREYWNNTKYMVRKKTRAHSTLSSREQKILSIMNSVSQAADVTTEWDPSTFVKIEHPKQEQDDSLSGSEELAEPSPQISQASFNISLGPSPSPPRSFETKEYPEAPPWVLSFQRERLKLKQKKLEFELKVAIQKQKETAHRTEVLERMASALERMANDVSAIRAQVDPAPE